MPTRSLAACFLGCALVGFITGLASFHNIPVLIAIFLTIFSCQAVGYLDGRAGR